MVWTLFVIPSLVLCFLTFLRSLIWILIRIHNLPVSTAVIRNICTGVVIHIKYLLLFMNKIPKLEINCIPSQLNTSPVTGVASQLANVAAQEPHYDGVEIGQMRGNPLYQRIDDIDKVGLAKAAMLKTAKTVKSNMKKIRAVNEIGQKLNKPKN